VYPADLSCSFNYESISLPEKMILRNDRIIVPIAERVAHSGLHSVSERLLAQDLVALCRSHIEFAPEHALFDREIFHRSVERADAARDLARDIVSRRDARIAANESRISNS
jgi:hypothetical protein